MSKEVTCKFCGKIHPQDSEHVVSFRGPTDVEIFSCDHHPGVMEEKNRQEGSAVTMSQRSVESIA